MVRLISYIPIPNGLTGGPRRLLSLAKVLTANGVEVCVATQRASPLLETAAAQGHSTASVDATGVLALRRKALFGGGGWFKLRVVLALIRQNFRFWLCICQYKGNAVWVRASKGVAFAALGTILSRRPLIWDVDFELPSQGSVRWLHRLGLWAAEVIVFQYEGAADSIFGEKLADRHRKKFETIIPGIDFSRLEGLAGRRMGPCEESSSKSFVILQVGTICDRKNQRILVESLRSLASENSGRGVTVQFAGGVTERKYVAELQSDAEKHCVANNVEFLGWRDDVHELMVKADLLVMPSKDEGVPNAVQEAMYLGMPVIVSEAGGMPEIVQNRITGWILPPNDPAAWADQIRECMDRPDLRKTVGAAAARYAGRYFSANEWGERYAAVIKNVVAARLRGTTKQARGY